MRWQLRVEQDEYSGLGHLSPSGVSSVEARFETSDLDSVLSRMTDFLRGAGFVFEGQLQVVDEVEEELGVIRYELTEIGREELARRRRVGVPDHGEVSPP